MHQLGIIEYCVATKYANLFGAARCTKVSRTRARARSHRANVYANAVAAAAEVDTMHKLNNAKRIGNKRNQRALLTSCSTTKTKTKKK